MACVQYLVKPAPRQLADNVKTNLAAARAKVEEVARTVELGDKGNLGELIFGPDAKVGLGHRMVLPEA